MSVGILNDLIGSVVGESIMGFPKKYLIRMEELRIIYTAMFSRFVCWIQRKWLMCVAVVES